MGIWDSYSGSGNGIWGGYKEAPTPPPQQKPTYGSVAHDFLGGIGSMVSSAVHHPVQTAVSTGKSLVSSVENDAKTVGSLVSQGGVAATKGVYHLSAAAIDAATGNKQAALSHIAMLNNDYSKSYISKTYSSKSKGDLSGLGNAAGFGLDMAGLKGGGSLVKNAGKEVVDAGIKGVAKTAGKGAAEGAALGAGYGGAQSLQQNDISAKNLARNAGAGAVMGALGGGVLGGVSEATKGALNKSLEGWSKIQTQAALGHAENLSQAEPKSLPAGEAQLGLPAGPRQIVANGKPLAMLPTHEPAKALGEGEKATGTLGAPEKQLALPAGSSKYTAGQNGGAFGLHEVSHETATALNRLNATVHSMSGTGEKLNADTRVATPVADGSGKPGDVLTHISQIQVLRNRAADTAGAIAQDRADLLKQTHDEMGGVTKIKNEEGQVTGRASQNDAFYSKYYKDNGRPPSKAAWLDEAHRQLQKGTDEQAQHYQSALNIADAAQKAYVEKVGTFRQSDLYATALTPEKQTAIKAKQSQVEAQAGKERLQGTPAPETKPAQSADQLKSNLAATENGTSSVGKLKALNSLIEHPDVSSADKQKYISQRDMLAPSAKSKPTPELVTKSEPNVNSKTTSAASMTTKRQPVYAQDFVETRAKKPTPKQAIKQRLVTDAKKKAATAGPVAEKQPGKATDVTGRSGSFVEKAVDRATSDKGAGLINPSRAASRQGNVKFARTATNLVSSKRVVTYKAKAAVSEFKKLAKGLSHDDITAAIEGGTPKNAQVEAAAKFFQAHRDAIGEASRTAGTIKGQKENYLPHIAKGLESKRGGRASGLSKNTRFNIERQSIEHTDAAGNVVKEDKYKTLNEFEAAIKKIDKNATAERDPAKLLEHLLITEGHAVENAKTVEKLMDTRMTDGRPVLARTTDANISNQKYKGFEIIDNKLVHPDAVPLYKAITQTGRINNPLGGALAKANVFTKRLVTINGMVHALNIWKSSFAAQGVTRSLFAIASKGASKEDFIRAIGYGAKFARASNDNLFDEVGKATDGVLGKLEKVTDPLTHALFHNFGDRQGMSAYLYIEKKAQRMGLSPDEAGRVAADGANQVMHFVPEDQQSIMLRQTSQLALFAGQFLQNTLKTATNAAGIGLDRTLSKGGQRAAQKLAIYRVARMFGYSFASAQAINFAATGRFTWQNGNGDNLNPVWYQTKDEYGNVKQYRITNHYGQLKDIANLLLNPAQEVQNKMAPGARELVSQIANTDLFTGNKIANSKTGEGQQLVDRLVHAASNMFTPAGINIQSPSKQPGIVQAAKYVGVNSSSTNPNSHIDYTKIATDKTEAQKLIGAYQKGDLSKLAAMQALKAGGNGYFDKFFSQHPELDPTSSKFQGFQGNNIKQIDQGIANGFTAAKANHTTLQYMQAIQQSGSTYFSKFFDSHPNLDPNSSNYQPQASTAQKNRFKSEMSYLKSKAKSTGSSLARSKGGKSVNTTIKKPKLTMSVKPVKQSSGKSLLKKASRGSSLVRRAKKIGI